MADVSGDTWFDYFDSGEPSNSGPYTTYVLLHGLCHNMGMPVTTVHGRGKT